MSLKRLVAGATLRRAASSPRQRIAMRPRRAAGLGMDKNSAFPDPGAVKFRAKLRTMWGFTKLARLIGRSRRQHLIDAPPVHIDDLEPPTQQFYGLSGLREMVHLSDHESCDGFVIAVLGQFYAQLFSHLVRRHPAGEQP